MMKGTMTIELIDKSDASHLNRPVKHYSTGKPVYMTIKVTDKGPEESMLKEDKKVEGDANGE